MNKRGVYFFVIDAFIGASIVLLGLVVVLSAYTSTQERNQPLVILEDLVTYFQSTQVRDFQGNYTSTLIDRGNISNPRFTIFEQVARFHFENNTALAGGMIGEVVNESLPSHYSLRYYYDDEILFERELFPYNSSGLVLSSRKIAMIPINASSVYGPHIAEVVVWTS